MKMLQSKICMEANADNANAVGGEYSISIYETEGNQ